MHASPRSLRQLAFVLAIAFGALALGACGSTASGNGGAATDASGKPLIAQPVSSAPVPATEAAIVADTDLTPEQKDALLAVYRSDRQANQV